MKKLILSAMLVMTTSAFADQSLCQVHPGVLNCTKGTIASLPGNFYGDVNLDGTQVSDHTQITAGNFTANHAQLNNVTITAGSIDLTSTVIAGKQISMTVGSLTLNDSALKVDAVLSSPAVELKNSTAHNLHIQSDQPQKKLVVKLESGSIVAGNIDFSNGNGEVCLLGGVLNGRVTGGKIVKGTCPDN